MHKRHKNRLQYFEEQTETTRKFVIPYFKELIDITPQTSVLEIGCGEAGNLKPFLDMGCNVTGIDISPNKIAKAELFFEGHKNRDKLNLISSDIYDVSPEKNMT